MQHSLVIGALVASMGYTAVATARQKVIAVLPFTSPHAYSSLGRNAQATFITALVKARRVRVIEATIVRRMLRRRGLAWAGVVEPRLLRAARRWLKADYLLAGKLRYTGGAYTISAHVTDVKTLATSIAEDIDFRHLGKMRPAMRLLARKIAAQIAGGRSADGKAGLFLNVNARAFYDTSASCLRVLRGILSHYNFRGSVAAVDGKKIKLRGPAYRLRPGVPIDLYDTGGIDGKRKLTTAYVTKVRGGQVEAWLRFIPDDGIPLTAQASNVGRQWVVAVGQVVDEAEGNAELVKRFRTALLEKMSEGNAFQQIEGSVTDWLAKQVMRKRRFFAYRKLFARGVELVLDGKFYGSSGSRRAHFKLYSTLTGKVVSELKFETNL